MRSPHKEVYLKSLTALTKFLVSRNELIDQVSNEIMQQVLVMVKDKDSEVHAIALRFLAHCFASDDPRYIDLGLANDVLFSFD